MTEQPPEQAEASFEVHPRTYRETMLQSGKKAFATIFEVCPLVALLLGLKYGRFVGPTHGSAGPPQG